ncbi:hypothetical protein GCM10010327_26170 [Streptomyces nitrosporeus]|nr:hypothetical protein GCM10010327_26170 [Streptomyces nitrosporeus]
MVDRLTVLLAQLGGDPRGSVSAVRLEMHRPYPGGQAGLGRLPGGSVRGCPAPVAEARAADAEDAAQPLHAVTALEGRRHTGSGSPARLPGEILGGFAQDLAFLPSSRTFFRKAAFSASHGTAG